MWTGLIHIYVKIVYLSGSVMGALGVIKLHLDSFKKKSLRIKMNHICLSLTSKVLENPTSFKKIFCFYCTEQAQERQHQSYGGSQGPLQSSLFSFSVKKVSIFK